ncbi:MAG: MotA/TolQ/ExbB proton channel family protein [Gemmatimonadales bacterium]|nr:MotA/TolQ/ExbB proton channel family protein [Gemmatimonadales bacterium]MDZ4388784.1 MotA/TolQ/ExbB proton channel family protein [Gemmatimonadales bacterium]
MNTDLLHLWEQSGAFAKFIIIVLAIMSVYSLTITFQKLMKVKKSESATRKFAPQFSRAIQEENLDQAIALAEKNKDSHVSRVLGGALTEVKPLLRDRATITSADINSAERAVERQMMIVLAEFKRGSGVLGTVGATAPFVGLLGTTIGIVNSFQAMSVGGGGAAGLSGIMAGIAEALIATAFGLLVAIPAVWAYNYFTTKVENLTVEMMYTSKELIDYLIKSVGSEFGRSIFTKEFQASKAVSGSGHISQ